MSQVKCQKITAAGIQAPWGPFLCGSGEGLPCGKKKNGNNESNKPCCCHFIRRTSPYHRRKKNILRWQNVLLSAVLVRPAAQSSRSGYWDVRIPPLLLIILDSFWRSSRGLGHVPRRLLPSPLRGHKAEGSPAALPVSTRAEPDASDCRPNLTSLLRVQGNISPSRENAHVSRALHNSKGEAVGGRVRRKV